MTSAAVRDALQARSKSRPGPVEAWSVAGQPTQDLVWRATLVLFARLGRPPLRAEIAEETNLATITVQVLLSELEGYDLLGVAKGAMSYAYPFTARRTAHRVTLHSQMLHALCAIDALGVGAMYGADAVIKLSCRTAERRFLSRPRSTGLHWARDNPATPLSGMISLMTAAPRIPLPVDRVFLWRRAS